tara:strand:+ start:3879 stop:4634 length:756 start_codon:yes stop_codon:yes gene_type:complete
MTDYLADVVMPTPSEQVPPSSPEPLPLTDEIIQEQMDIEESEASYEVEEEEEEIIPEPERRRKIPQEEIFSTPKVKTILDPESMKDPVEDIPPEKKTKQTRKKRGPASAEQLERLARGREKAKETRARKKLEKEEKLKKDKSDKELVEAVRDRERKKLRKKLETPIDDEETIVPKVQIVEKPVVVEKGYSQKDLDDAVSRAVEQSVNRVEVLRKQRKDVKKKAQAKADHDAKVFKEINTAMKNDVWANCFV